MTVEMYVAPTRLLRALLKANIAITAIAVLACIYQWLSYRDLPPEIDTYEVFLLSDVVIGIVGLIQFTMFFVVGPVFLRWIYKMNETLRTTCSDQMEFTPGWSIGWYFVPIANFFKPFQAMREIWLMSHKGVSASYSILGWWWFLWIVSNFVGRIVLRAATHAENAGDYATSSLVYLLSDGIDVALNVVALVMVTRIAEAYANNFVAESPAVDPSLEEHSSKVGV